MSVPDLTTSPSTAPELSAFQQTILTLLAEESQYGLAIKRKLEAYYDADVNHGRLYPNLNELIEMGVVEKNQLDGRTNEYKLTDTGYEALLEQLSWQFNRIAIDDERVDDLQMLLDTMSEHE